MRVSRWVIIATYTLFAYVSGFVPVAINERLSLRNVSAVQGSSDQRDERPQIKEIAVEAENIDLTAQTKKDDEETPLRQGSEGRGEGRVQLASAATLTPSVVQNTTNGSAQGILSALNNYRQARGKGTLAWDQKLADFAQSRSSSFVSQGSLDNHAGFTSFINNQDGFHALGFMSLGENSSLGYASDAVQLIEQVYAGDKPHDDNQLNSDWTHVGIGVSGTATDLVFGGKKL